MAGGKDNLWLQLHTVYSQFGLLCQVHTVYVESTGTSSTYVLVGMFYLIQNLSLLYDLFLKNDANEHSKSKKQITLKIFSVVLKVTDEKKQDAEPLVRGVDPDPYQNVMGSGTLEKSNFFGCTSSSEVVVFC